MPVVKQAFGQVLHADLLGAKPGFVVPEALDAKLLHPAAETKFLSDDVKVVLGLPLTHRPRMAVVDDVLFKEYLSRLVDSATKLDELMADYEELENSTPGMNRDRLHTTVQQSVQLISRVKVATVHVALDGVGRWLKKQQYELERTQGELDTFDDTEICVPQGDDEEEPEEQTQSPEEKFAGVKAKSQSNAGGKSRSAAAVKRKQATVQQQAAASTPKAGTAQAAAASLHAQNAAASPRSPTPMAAAPDAIILADADDLDSAGASPGSVAVPSQALPAPLCVPGPAVPQEAPGGGKSPRGKKQKNKTMSNGISEGEIGNLKELRGTVSS
eukprot:jgi/Ulvmu1/12869/UM098_0054.1